MLFIGILTIYVLNAEPTLNPHLERLVEMIRMNYRADNGYWILYTKSLIEERRFSENTEQIGGLHNIKEREIKFVDKIITEPEFCYQIGIDFANDGMPRLSEWFLNKAEFLGFVNTETYRARVRNNAQEWNSILHYNQDLSDPALEIYEAKWRENLLKVIENSKDSLDIEYARLALTTIYSPGRTSMYVNHFAPEVISSLKKFIGKYSKSPVIHQAYERLIWWLYETKKNEELAKVCKEFLRSYPDSPIIEYVKAQLGNAYYFIGNYDEAKRIYHSIKKDSFPNSVYPGWGGRYILEAVEERLKSIEAK